MKYLLSLVLLGLVIACKNSGDTSEIKDVRTDSIISRELMVRILVDTHLAEAALIKQRNEGVEDPAMARYYYHGIFAKYKISRKRFYDNLTYYRKNPTEFSKMYEQVISLITERQKNYTPKK